MISVLVGVVSTLGDESFPRLILGDGYMDMTLENIAKGQPMGVYGQESEANMFLSITLNNIMVSFNVFVSGVLTSFMSGILLFRNGIMIGCFDTFFYQHGLLGESLLATMLHGTLELSAIIVAGAAGLAIGNGWLFPGTYSRIVSFQRWRKEGNGRLLWGTIPIFYLSRFYREFHNSSYGTERYCSAQYHPVIISFCRVLFLFTYLINVIISAMQIERPKIELYEMRSFGEKILCCFRLYT